MATTPKKVTINELKTFIEAVEFATDTDDWVPSKRQWVKIREMIDRLEETGSTPQVMQLPIPMQQPYPVQMAPGGLSMTQPGPIQIPHGVPIAGGNNPSQAVKTPDIDTSRGSYQSSFA
jgi:hypothetical protein